MGTLVKIELQHLSMSEKCSQNLLSVTVTNMEVFMGTTSHHLLLPPPWNGVTASQQAGNAPLDTLSTDVHCTKALLRSQYRCTFLQRTATLYPTICHHNPCLGNTYYNIIN